MTALLGACTHDDSRTDSEKPSRGLTLRDRRDVPIPSFTNPADRARLRKAWHEMWRTTPGTPEHRCVDVGAHRDVRSGDFIVGNFASFIRRWDGTLETSKLYYIPAYPMDGQPLEIVAERRDEAAPQHVTFTFDGFAWTSGSEIPFYVSGTVLPVRGHWRLTATAGQNSGCFELTL